MRLTKWALAVLVSSRANPFTFDFIVSLPDSK